MDREQVMSWLEGLAEPDWRDFHSDNEVQNIAKSALSLLKEQETVEHALEVLKANGWKKTRQRDIYSDETYSVIKKKA